MKCFVAGNGIIHKLPPVFKVLLNEQIQIPDLCISLICAQPHHICGNDESGKVLHSTVQYNMKNRSGKD